MIILNNKKKKKIIIAIIITFIFIIIKIIYIQNKKSNLIKKKYNIYTNDYDNKYKKTIKDRNNNILASSIKKFSVCINPNKILKNRNYKIIINKILKMEKILSIDKYKILNKINSNKKKKFIYIKRKINNNEFNIIKKLNIPGVSFKNDNKRLYPLNKKISHLIGISDINENGLEGIEKKFNLFLNNKSKKNTYYKKNSCYKNELNLSIDKKMQYILYNEIKKGVKKYNASCGTSLLIDVITGEILAMVNYPSFDSNNINTINKNNIRNIIITDLFEPGSIIKPLIIMEALRKNIINENTIINTLPYKIDEHLISDVSKSKKMNLIQILQKSSNIGISKISLFLSTKNIINVFSKFGLFKNTNLNLIGENKGIYNFNKNLTNINKINLSYGYGFMSNIIQLSKIYYIIANYGAYSPITIFKKTNKNITKKQIYPKNIVKKIIKILKKTSEYEGSSYKAKIKNYNIATKTGTSKIIGNNKKYINRYISYIIGFAPVNKPRYTLSVIINNPKYKYYGGEISAPIFSKIMEKILRLNNIKPDNLYKKT